MAEGDDRAGERLRAEARPSSAGRRKRSHVVTLLAELVGLAGPSRWPPVDVVLIDVRTGRTVKTWHEGGDDASVLRSVLNEELAEMSYGEFVEKRDVSPES